MLHGAERDVYESYDPKTADEITRWNPALQAIPMPGIRRMVNMAAEMDDVLHLSLGQPDFRTPQPILDAHISALEHGQTAYTMDAGLPELLTELKTYYNKRYDIQLSEENFLITTGATEAIYLALTAMAAPGRQFLVVDPTFLTYAPIIRTNGGEVRVVPTRADNSHQVDPQRVIDAMTMRTYGVVLCTPNNPTGAVYPKETIDAIVREAAYRGIKVFSDEVYDHLILDDMEFPSVLRSTADLDHVMVVGSFSKTFAMPGLRVGWVISSMGSIKMLRRLHMFTTTVANTPAQIAAITALKECQGDVDKMVTEYRKRRDRVVHLVGETPHLNGYWPQGAFYIMPDLPHHADGTQVALRLLEETGVCVVPGDAFGESSQNALRISFSAPMERIEAAFERMIPWFKKQKF